VDLLLDDDVKFLQSSRKAHGDGVRVRLRNAGHFVDIRYEIVPNGEFFCQKFCTADIIGSWSSNAEQNLSVRQSLAGLRDLFVHQSRWPRATGGRSSNSGGAKIVPL